MQLGNDAYLDLKPPALYEIIDAGILVDHFLVALRPIRQGEEVRYDLSTTMGDGGWTMPCHCGAPNCRGVVRDFIDLPVTVRTEYLNTRESFKVIPSSGCRCEQRLRVE